VEIHDLESSLLVQSTMLQIFIKTIDMDASLAEAIIINTSSNKAILLTKYWLLSQLMKFLGLQLDFKTFSFSKLTKILYW
jgi:hypothetical protein